MSNSLKSIKSIKVNFLVDFLDIDKVNNRGNFSFPPKKLDLRDLSRNETIIDLSGGTMLISFFPSRAKTFNVYPNVIGSGLKKGFIF